MKQKGGWLCALVVWCYCLPAMARQQPAALQLQIAFPPQPVTINGAPALYYELLVTNQGKDAVQLQQLQLRTSVGRVLHTFDSAGLRRRYGRQKDNPQDTATLLLAGVTRIIYVEASLPGQSALIHRLSYTVPGKSPASLQQVEGAPLGDKLPAARIIGPPLQKGTWAAVYDPSWTRGHRRVVYTVDGKDRIPGRWAIDFILLDAQGRYASGEENEIKHWLGYGAPVIAVADGIVAAILNDFPESKTISDHTVYPAEKATGNYISLDIGQGQYAFYEHLQPGSIRVKPGQRVKKGEVIAALGFTGQTTGPHLHFHIANANSPLGAEGLPFAFGQFTLEGTYPDFSQFGKASWTPQQRPCTKERPAPNTVIRFR